MNKPEKNVDITISHRSLCLAAISLAAVGCAHAAGSEENISFDEEFTAEQKTAAAPEANNIIATVTIPLAKKPQTSDLCSSIGFGKPLLSVAPGMGDIGSIGVDEEGNIDLSQVTAKGDIQIDVVASGNLAPFVFWPDSPPPYAYGNVAVAIAPNTPQFGEQYWPNPPFDPPIWSSPLSRLSFVDKDDDARIYEYSIKVAYFGRSKSGFCVLDPRIKNKADTR